MQLIEDRLTRVFVVPAVLDRERSRRLAIDMWRAACEHAGAYPLERDPEAQEHEVTPVRRIWRISDVVLREKCSLLDGQ